MFKPLTLNGPLLGTLLLAPFLAFAQNRTWVHLNPTIAPTQDLSFTSPDEGWSIDYFGKVQKTDDGGKTWSMPVLPDSSVFSLYGSGTRRIAFRDGSRGFIIANTGVLLRTQNAGRTWERRTFAVRRSLEEIAMAGTRSTWIRCDSGLLLHSRDDGQAWEVQRIRNWVDRIHSMHFLDSLRGWITTNTTDTIYHTRDGGRSWNPIGLSGRGFNYAGVHFSDDSVGWVAGQYGVIRKTTNGGRTWSFSRTTGQPYNAQIHFVNPQFGWILDNRGYSITRNGGQTWQRHRLGAAGNSPAKILFMTDSLGWILSNKGIFRTKNGGRTWTLPEHGMIAQINTLQFMDERTAYGSNLSGLLQKSDDGGYTWRISLMDSMILNKFRFVTRDVGFAVGALDYACCTDRKDGVIYRTTDGGRSWARTVFTSPDYTSIELSSVFFLDSARGWAVGVGKKFFTPDRGLMFKTTDGGRTWTMSEPANLRSISDIQFLDSTNGWLSSYFGAYKTTDGGRTWQDVLITTTTEWETSKVHFYDRDFGFIYADRGVEYLYKTQDGGRTWANTTPTNMGLLYDMHAFDRNNWLLGTSYRLQMSRDGGTTWIMDPQRITGYANGGMASLSVLDSNRIWAGNAGVYRFVDSTLPVRAQPVTHGKTSLFSLFPSPSTGELKVVLESAATVQIRNQVGATVRNLGRLPKGTYILRLESLPKGVYLVSATSSKTRVSRKLLLE